MGKYLLRLETSHGNGIYSSGEIDLCVQTYVENNEEEFEHIDDENPLGLSDDEIAEGNYGMRVKCDAFREEYTDHPEYHPAPSYDSLLEQNAFKLGLDLEDYVIPNYIFGFGNYAQFRAWFFNDSLLEIMEEHGIVLKLYYAEDFVPGNTQFMLHTSSCEVAKFPPTVSESEIKDFIQEQERAECGK